MALNFLTGLSNFASAAAPGINAVGQIMNAIRGDRGVNNIASYASQPTGAELWTRDLLDALVNPDSPLAKNLAASEFATNRDAFLTQIKGMQSAGNRAVARGQRSAFFDPERRDEAVDYLTSRGLPMLQNQAQKNALERIATTATGTRNLVSPEFLRQQLSAGAMQSMESNRQINPLSRVTDTMGGIQSLLKALGNARQQAYML